MGKARRPGPVGYTRGRASSLVPVHPVVDDVAVSNTCSCPFRDELKPTEFVAPKERLTVSNKEELEFAIKKHTRSTGPYDRAFQQHLIDHDVLPHGYEYPDGRLPPEPDKIDEIRQILVAPRKSLSPSQFTSDDFRKFERADTHAARERDVTTAVIPVLEGNARDRKCVAGALGARAIHSLQSYGQVPRLDNRAYAITSIYHGGTLKIEASAADTIVASQTTVLHPDSNAQTTYESDSSDDPLTLDFQPLDSKPPAKRTKSRSRSPRKKA
ncbi:hypothetical protein TOPH_09152 [Tolypocladium ophioglossoides CBS 100239]|uniref:Uncharacterized protein n=1 Tax=Tolypocladium ophioglossoides (strain CBS 100239) TaxID=1163406 RepID=A0A0L0MWC7_TOLOC|nr:hypothetical protein TOPH_09152 [Tolypocladium ophioglossoides CBS 100239]